MDKKQTTSVNQSQKTGIVLNRMYTGSYLSSNLGHEVINMFQADDGKHYLYLNAKGNYAKMHKGQISDMLLVRYVGENKVEVLAWANNLNEIQGADDTYKDFEYNGDIFQNQKKYIKDNNITYGRRDLIDIFGGSDQQNVYITYVANDFYRPQKRIYIQYVEECELFRCEDCISRIERRENDLTIVLTGYQFGKATLKQYIYSNTHPNGIYKFDRRKKIDGSVNIENLEELVNRKRSSDWEILNTILNPADNSIWNKVQKDKCRITDTLIDNHKSKEVSLFDIVPKLQRDENCFSDVLRHFMDSHKDEWQEIFKNLCNNLNIGKVCSIEREKDATIGKTKKGNNSDSNGGRIDLLIRTENAYIVIENKIKSDINSKASDGVDENQLKRYSDYVKYCIIGDYITTLPDESVKKKLSESYKTVTPMQLKDFEKEVLDAYKKLNKSFPKIKSYFFVLAPDYNMPSKEERNGYLPLYYSTLVGKDKTEMVEDTAENVGDYPYLQEVAEEMRRYHENHAKDNLWMPFYDAMMRHSYNYENDSLYEDMKNTFFARIQKCPKVKVSSNLDQNA